MKSYIQDQENAHKLKCSFLYLQVLPVKFYKTVQHKQMCQ